MLLMSHRRSKQKGSALVETSLVLIVFICVLIGIVDFAQFLYLHEAIANRVSRVARTASVYGLSESQIQNQICFGANDKPDNAGGYMGLTPSNITTETKTVSATSKLLVVTVTGLRYKTFSPYLFGSATMMRIRATSPMETTP